MPATAESEAQATPESGYDWPDATGFFGPFGGRFVAETLMPAVQELEEAFRTHAFSESFAREFEDDLRDFVGRPSPLYFAQRWSREAGGARIYLKREDLNHTGAHKINHAVGQALLAKRMGKTRIIAETGAGQHGVATATVAARAGLECVVYMGARDMERQKPNVYRMKLLGARVVPVTSGAATLKNAVNEALRDWLVNVDNTFYVLGSVVGPAPYPEMIRTFQSVTGHEVRAQCEMLTGRTPDTLVACIGGGSNAMGLFHPFIEDKAVEMFGVEGGGEGVQSGRHACCLSLDSNPGVLHGTRTYLFADEDGNVNESHSVSAGLDYPGVGPEHSWLKKSGRVRYVSATDEEALDAFKMLSRTEGIIPALESSHALAFAGQIARERDKDHIIVVNLSGRGDKDIGTVAALEQADI